jgi:pyrroline-5-carboxylate reductase
MKTIAIIGSGKMAEALLKGFLNKKLFVPQNITMTDVSAERLTFMAKTYGVRTTINNLQAFSSAEIVLLAIKPQTMPAVLAELQASATSNQIIVSIAAGISIAQISGGKNLKVVRAMPNTPALIGQSATAVACNSVILPAEKNSILGLFQSVGVAVEVSEEQINAVTGLSGSGPAFVFRLMEYCIEAGTELGLSKDVAQKLLFQNFWGSAQLAFQSTDSLETLINNVTSPNGTTAAGREILEKSAVKNILKQTIIRAKQRADELGGTK